MSWSSTVKMNMHIWCFHHWINHSCACHTQFINHHFDTQPAADNKSLIIKYQISDNKIIRQALMLHNIKTIKLTTKTKGNLLRVSVQ